MDGTRKDLLKSLSLDELRQLKQDVSNEINHRLWKMVGNVKL